MLRQACLRLCPLQCSAPAWSRGIKESTYLTGMEVDPEAETSTPAVLRELQEYVREKIPRDVEYRKHVESYCSRFLKVIESSSTQADAEETLGRQFEQIQEDVDSERTVIDTMAQWKPWIAAEGHAPKLFAELKDIPENVRAFREFQHDLATK